MPVLIVGPSLSGKSLITNLLLAASVNDDELKVPATLADEPNGRRYFSEIHTSQTFPFLLVDTVCTGSGSSIYREVTYLVDKYVVPKIGVVVLVLDFTVYYTDEEIEDMMHQFEGFDLRAHGILILTHYDDDHDDIEYFEQKETTRLPDCFFRRFRNVVVTDNSKKTLAWRCFLTLSSHLSNCAWHYDGGA